MILSDTNNYTRTWLGPVHLHLLSVYGKPRTCGSCHSVKGTQAYMHVVQIIIYK